MSDTTVPTTETPKTSRKDAIRRGLLIAAGAVAGIIIADVIVTKVNNSRNEKALALETLSDEDAGRTYIETPAV